MKKRTFIALLALVFLLLAFVSCKDTNKDKSGANYSDEVFDSLIADWKSAFHTAISENNPDSGGFSFGFYDMSGFRSSKAYYALYDIDGNGISELILRKQNDYEDIIAYIFAIKDGEPINIFGYNLDGSPCEVPWSSTGSSNILNNGLIDCYAGDYSIYRMADDGYTLIKVASAEPYDYPDEASLGSAKWQYYVNGVPVDEDFFIQFLDEQGYKMYGDLPFAPINWKRVD